MADGGRPKCDGTARCHQESPRKWVRNQDYRSRVGCLQLNSAETGTANEGDFTPSGFFVGIGRMGRNRKSRAMETQPIDRPSEMATQMAGTPSKRSQGKPASPVPRSQADPARKRALKKQRDLQRD